MTYEELYRLHYANGDVALAALYKELCSMGDAIADLEDDLFECQDGNLSRKA